MMNLCNPVDNRMAWAMADSDGTTAQKPHAEKPQAWSAGELQHRENQDYSFIGIPRRVRGNSGL
jgi:hypothetical protein